MYKDKVLRPALVNVASNPSGVIVKKEPAPAAAEAAPEATAEAAPAAPAPAPEAPAPAPEAPAPEAEVSAQAPEAPAPAPEAATPEAKAPEPATAAPEPAAAAPAESAAPEAPAAEPAQPTAPAEPPPKKAIDKLKPTRVHTETQDLPVFKIEDYAESLAPEPELEIVDTEPVKEAATGTVYDITDVDIEEKPAGQEEPVGE